VSEQPHAAHDDHGHHGSPFVQHHYDDAQHQFDSGKLGIWLFLAQEVLFFSALFVAYILYRHHHGEIWMYAHKYLDTKMGAINTAVLIFSSLTAAWAVRAAQLRQQKLLIACLAATLACAFGFLVIKYFEYTHKVHEHILFGKRFDPCISSNGTPLPTKNNECPGTKTTVKWDFASGTGTGCFPDIAIDQDPREPLVQAKCKVRAVTGSVKLVDKKEVFTKKSEVEIANVCYDGEYGPLGGLLPDANGNPSKSKFPCWKPKHQPAVCKIGWFYAWGCEGEKCEKKSGGEGPFASLQACDEAKRGKSSALGSQGKATVTDCANGQASAIVVEYGDHDVRKSPHVGGADGLVIEADCDGPPSVGPPDFFAEQQRDLTPGAASTTTKKPLDQYDLKEMGYSGPPPEHTSMFFTIYFAMTGLHGIHVLFGVFIFIWLLIRAAKGHFTPDYFGPVDFAALYWHIVDLIWIFLFPLMYLIH
jgi:heme/copper-type cytochrome/quinol oxidase subunit 3